jgi:hypothetical protein
MVKRSQVHFVFVPKLEVAQLQKSGATVLGDL